MRVVPVNLIDGKWYVTRGGYAIRVQRRADRQEIAQFPFEDGDGVIYQRNGKARDIGEHTNDIIRPAYLIGETYATRGDGDNIKLTKNLDSTYCFAGIREGQDDEGPTFTEDGLYYEDEENESDLMDYTQPKLAGVAASLIITDEVTMDKQQTVRPIGARVSYPYDGKAYTGTVHSEHSTDLMCVEFDADQHFGGQWDCNGTVPSKRGYYCYVDDLTLIPQGWDKVDTATEAAPPAAPTPKLMREDRKLLWDLFVSNNRDWSLDNLIAQRLKIDAACER